MKKRRNILFLLTGEQWLGVLLLALLVVGTLFLVKRLQDPSELADAWSNDSTKTQFFDYQGKQDSIRRSQWEVVYKRDTIEICMQSFDPNTADSATLVHLGFKPWQAKNMLKYRAKGGRYRNPEDLKKLYGMTDSMYQSLVPYICIALEEVVVRDTIEICMQPFDPNTADSVTLVHLGFKPWQAKNMLKYRAKGGRYRNPEDLKKLYGMTDSMYHALESYICIEQAAEEGYIGDSIRHDSVPRWVSEKKDTILNLRTADTTELKMIRGIGSYRARQIVYYREQLGGFVRVEQLLEARGMEMVADSILKYFVLDSLAVEPLRVNSAGVRQLSRHPYLRFEQAKAIYELRRKNVKLDSIEQLYELDCLSEEVIEKLAPYLNFDKNS